MAGVSWNFKSISGSVTETSKMTFLTSEYLRCSIVQKLLLFKFFKIRTYNIKFSVRGSTGTSDDWKILPLYNTVHIWTQLSPSAQNPQLKVIV